MFCKRIALLLMIFISLQRGRAQLLTDLGDHHNQLFIGSGYTESFGNITYGINHIRYFKSIKRDVVGILDFTSPISNQYVTRFIFRKGFQFDLYKKGDFKIPITLVTSSVKKKLYLIAFHDIVTDLYILPGIYRPKYTIAADLSARFLVFHRVRHDHQPAADANMKFHRVNIGLGIILAHNFERFSFIFRGGFQQINDWEITKAPIYAIGSVAYKFNFRKHKPDVK